VHRPLDPVIPAAERALESGSYDELVDVLCGEVQDQVARRHMHAMALKDHAGEGVAHARAYIEAMRCSACRCGRTACTAK